MRLQLFIIKKTTLQTLCSTNSNSNSSQLELAFSQVSGRQMANGKRHHQSAIGKVIWPLVI